MFGMPHAAGRSGYFSGMGLKGFVFGRHYSHRRFLDGLWDVDRPDALLRLSRSAKLRASAYFQRVHKLVDVLLCRERSQGAIQVLSPHAAFAFTREVVFEACRNLFDVFHGKRVKHTKARAGHGFPQEHRCSERVCNTAVMCCLAVLRDRCLYGGPVLAVESF